MRKEIFLAVALLAVGSMLVPLGPVAEVQARPIPEPSSLILLGTGFLSLLRYLRNRA